MAKQSLNHSAQIRHRNFVHLDNLINQLNNAAALLHVATDEQFLEQESWVIYNYLWVLRNIIAEAEQECEQIALF